MRASGESEYRLACWFTGGYNVEGEEDSAKAEGVSNVGRGCCDGTRYWDGGGDIARDPARGVRYRREECEDGGLFSADIRPVLIDGSS